MFNDLLGKKTAVSTFRQCTLVTDCVTSRGDVEMCSSKSVPKFFVITEYPDDRSVKVVVII